MRRWMGGLFLIAGLFFGWGDAFGAYHHMGEVDSGRFTAVHPDKAGSKLDSCALCHTGGQVTQGSKTVSYGSCQYCHYKYGYDASGSIDATLNAYGRAYRDNGRSEAAVTAIESLDSDGDGYTNKVEIEAVRFPGDANDDPGKTVAPYKVYSRADLEELPQHTQFLVMNAHKSTDYYAQYTGVTLEELLNDAGMLSSATGIKVYAPDGFSQYHPLTADLDPILYHAIGEYPVATYYYDASAAYDSAINPAGWCDYSSPSCDGRAHGETIQNPSGLKTILAYLRDGSNLTAGVLTSSNKLDGEGPYRVVPPQKTVGPPDQRSTASKQSVVWPFDARADHNAGYSTRTATIIKVEPLPAGTTDIDLLEAGWKYVDEGKVVVYGAIDPMPSIEENLETAATTIQAADTIAALEPGAKARLLGRLEKVKRLIDKGKKTRAVQYLTRNVLKFTDGCARSGIPDAKDLVKDCAVQQQLNGTLAAVASLLAIH